MADDDDCGANPSPLISISVRITGVEVYGVALAQHRFIAVDIHDELTRDDIDEFRARVFVGLH